EGGKEGSGGGNPFELQVSAGCTEQAGKALGSFLNGAYQGSDFLSFQGNSWKPSPGAGSPAQKACEVLNNYLDIKEIVQSLLRDTCPRFLAGILKAGKSELERQVKPEAWLSAGPPPGPGRLLLVCHVSGFHPKPVWVMWMRGEQEQRGTRRGDVLPHADGTWYLRVTLDVAAREAAGLSCRVRHSSLGGQDIVLHWGEKELGPSWETTVLGLLREVLGGRWEHAAQEDRGGTTQRKKGREWAPLDFKKWRKGIGVLKRKGRRPW
uniref:Ig-like domain-containing protein n=1 Tax=Neovison vison TaxID=452646 RepID=A0A8C7BRR1_NEOVI